MKRPAWLRPRWVRLVGWIPVGGLAIALTWLMTTQGGLNLAARIGTWATDGALTIAEANGALAYDISLDQLRYETNSVTVTIEHADLVLRLPPLLLGRIQAKSLSVESLSVATHDTPPDPGPREKLTVPMPVALAVEEGEVHDFRISIGEAGWRWHLPQAAFSAQWHGQWITIGRLWARTHEAGSPSLRGRLAIVDDQLLIEKVEVEGRGKAKLDGAIALHDDAANDLVASWRALQWVDPGTLDWLSSAQGRATLKGPWRNYRWTLAGDVDYFGNPAAVTSRGRGTLASLTLEDIVLKTFGGEIAGDGKIGWSPDLDTRFALRWQGLDPGQQHKEWPGRLNGEGRFDARWNGDDVKIDFDAALADSTLRGFPLSMQVTGRTEKDAVYLKALKVQSGASTVSAAGQLLPKFSLEGELSSSDLRSLWAGLAGSGVVKAQLRGTMAAPEIGLRGGLDDLVWQRYRARHAALDATLAPQGHSQVSLELDDVRAGASFRQLKLDAAGTRKQHEAHLSASAAEGETALTVTGSLRGTQWHGELATLSVNPSRGESWKLEEPAALRVSGRNFGMEPLCLASGGSRACARVEFSRDAVEFAFRTKDFDLTHLKPWLPPDLSVSGKLTGTAALEVRGSELTAITADLAGTPGSFAAAGSTLNYGPGVLRIAPENGRLHVTLDLTPAGGTLRGEVWVAAGGELPDRPMLGDLTIRLPDLTWLPLLSPEIGAAEGSLESQLQVSGTPRVPKLDGKVALAGGRVQLVTPGIELSGITAAFSRERSGALAVHAEGQSGGGKLTIDGALSQLQPEVTGEITIRGDDVQGFNTAEFRAWLSPDLKLALGKGVARLTGTLAVPRAEITPREIASGGVGPSGDQVIVEDEPSGGSRLRIESEVKIALGDNVRFDGLGLKTRLTGAITAYDDPERPTRGVGELRLDGGRYKAYGQDLTIETGRLIFTGGPVTDPAVDFTAYRKPREDIKVGLHARGTLEAPEFSLFSEPTLAQEEQLSWLVLGRSLAGTLDTAQQTQLSGAALSFGFTGGEYLAQQLAPRLGLDEVSVGAKPGETADLARFTVGKYLSPKLFVSYGVGLFQPGHFFRMQYDLGRHFKLQGESGTTQGGDILYTIEK